ncbi:MAG: hypothetical protein CMM50_12165 [Rhodospirillaceae bacterium]|nr:hypothetical protein [Rhodospirillaceae bacterium]
MKDEIGGKIYDTAQATCIKRMEFAAYSQALYRTKDGEFFVAMEIADGGSISVVSRERAQKILNKMKELS